MGPPAKRRRAEASPQGGAELVRALNWLNSYSKVSRWAAQYRLDELVERGGGIVRISNFLPDFVAEGALRILEALPPGRWNDTAADEDYRHNNIAHQFWSVKAGGNAALEALLRAFSLLCPDQFPAFSAARYEQGHHIAPHDDRAYTPVRLDTGEVISCSRDLTCVYYLTKDWTAAMGGCLVDLEADPEPEPAPQAAASGSSGGGGAAQHPAAQHPAQQRQGRVYVPEFNTAVFFRVPRYHSVTPLTTTRPRFSVFGWYLQPGQLYELFNGQEEDIEQQIAYRRRQRGAAAAPAAPPAPAAAAEEAEPGGDLEGPLAPERCKLAQRLLARAAGGGQPRRRQQRQAGKG